MTGFSKAGLLAGALAVFALGLSPALAQQAAPDPSADAAPRQPSETTHGIVRDAN
jgi:hypothetical protein